MTATEIILKQNLVQLGFSLMIMGISLGSMTLIIIANISRSKWRILYILSVIVMMVILTGTGFLLAK
jgi:hypothetical protein